MHSALHKLCYMLSTVQFPCADGCSVGATGPTIYRLAVVSSVPTIRRRRLGAALRRLREETGLTTTEVAERMGWSHSKVSRIETAKTPVTAADVRELLTIYEIASDEADALVALARDAKQRDWWHSYSEVLPEWFEVYLGLESEASRLSVYEAELIPGLLQTEAYATALLRSHPITKTPDETEQAVRLRRARQARLDGETPIVLDAVINEGALRRLVGGAEVMRAQLHDLATAAELPNVTVQVLPFVAGAHAGINGSFHVLEFPDPETPRVVYVDNLTSSLYLERSREVGKFRLAFEELQTSALTPDESTSMIADMAKEL